MKRIMCVSNGLLSWEKTMKGMCNNAATTVYSYKVKIETNLQGGGWGQLCPGNAPAASRELWEMHLHFSCNIKEVTAAWN
jgi:hypothetical protein